LRPSEQLPQANDLPQGLEGVQPSNKGRYRPFGEAVNSNLTDEQDSNVPESKEKHKML